MMNKTEEDVFDLEECASKGIQPPKGARYRIKIDKEKFEVNVPELTGRQLLELAQKHPIERWRIDQRLKSGKTKRVGLDEYSDFTEPGVERYMTIPLDQTEG